MRARATRACLAVAMTLFIASAFVLGEATSWLLITAAFALVPALFGSRWVRATGIVIVAFSVGLSVLAKQAAQRMQARMQEIREKAGER